MNPIPGRSWGWFGFGRGWGRGRGWFGRGWRHWYWATGLPGWVRAAQGLPAFGGWVYPYYGLEMTPKEEMDMLKNQADILKQELDEIQRRISTLEKAQAGEEKNE
jgi:hypothetical protein